MTLLSRITIDPAICHGKPCIRGMRWPVEVILDLLGSGMAVDDIINDHPELEREDITVSLNYARVLVLGINIETEQIRTHSASEQVLSKDWLNKTEERVWKYL